MNSILSPPSSASPETVSEADLWAIVAQRGTGDFRYGVTTMGVYCRPDCPAPRPLRAHARFFADNAAAEAAGFRACKRCDPTGARAAIARAVVEDACAALEQAETAPSLDDLARRAGFSRFHFLRLFKAHTGLTPRQYGARLRAERLGAELAAGARVVDAVAGAGYGSESRVYERTASLLGMTPGAARRGGAGEVIRTAFADSPYGRLLLGATARGVCFLGFGETDAQLRADLIRRFPKAMLQTDDAGLAEHLAAVISFMREPAAALSLPLDLRGTAFQRRVWQALTQVPVGTTTTYTALAEAIGAPRAVRAVASGCATNPVSLAVPCHRVIGRDGGLRGYRWGLERKRALIAAEKKLSPAR
ncbi:MAG: methylated-DNA--[protein]-cysteine S-methyltransferase [Rhodospirillales bacterium]|nr:methylated-DNA--[protein]-cysteine S-methyltransferase [Rhodospirillales bacterium]